MNLSMIKLVYSLPINLRRIKCRIEFDDMNSYLEIRIRINPQLVGYFCVDKNNSKIYALHLWSFASSPALHSRAVRDDIDNVYFSNQGNFHCFIKTDPFDITVDKFISFAEEMTKG